MIFADVKFVNKLKLILTIIECFVECSSKHRTETDASLDAITFWLKVYFSKYNWHNFSVNRLQKSLLQVVFYCKLFGMLANVWFLRRSNAYWRQNSTHQISLKINLVPHLSFSLIQLVILGFPCRLPWSWIIQWLV